MRNASSSLWNVTALSLLVCLCLSAYARERGPTGIAEADWSLKKVAALCAEGKREDAINVHADVKSCFADAHAALRAEVEIACQEIALTKHDAARKRRRSCLAAWQGTEDADIIAELARAQYALAFSFAKTNHLA